MEAVQTLFGVIEVMSLTQLPIDDLRTLCRNRLETLELWLRRLIHDKLTAAYGHGYLEHEVSGNYIFRGDVRRKASARMRESPDRFSRPVDALFLDELVTTLCKQDLHREHFRDALSGAFPDGSEEARSFLSRLVDIRNLLAHANPISDHQALRVFCYSQDIIKSIADHYESLGMSKEFNSPTFVAFRDSMGHAEYIAKTFARLDFRDSILHPGDRLRVQVDVDDSFSMDTYAVNWVVANISKGESGKGSSFEIVLTPRHVGESFSIVATLKSVEEWHRHTNFDAQLIVYYKVLPSP